MKHVPQHCQQALEIGCGSGAFARLLATRAEQVLALDVSPQTIRVAEARSQQYPNITFHVADALSWEFPSNDYDCIDSIATLHHVPLEEMLAKMKQALRVNGVLLTLDLYQESLAGSFTSLAALPDSLILKYLNTGRFREPPAVQAAWAVHGKHDIYLTLLNFADAATCSCLKRRSGSICCGVILSYGRKQQIAGMAGQPYRRRHAMNKLYETSTATCFFRTNGLFFGRT